MIFSEGRVDDSPTTDRHNHHGFYPLFPIKCAASRLPRPLSSSQFLRAATYHRPLSPLHILLTSSEMDTAHLRCGHDMTHSTRSVPQETTINQCSQSNRLLSMCFSMREKENDRTGDNTLLGQRGKLVSLK